jgi:hypothetical protein
MHTHERAAGRPGSAAASTTCVPVNGHASIHLFRRPAGGGACGGSTGCRAKAPPECFSVLLCHPGRTCSQIDGIPPIIGWASSARNSKAVTVRYGTVAARRRRRWHSAVRAIQAQLDAGEASGSRDFGTCVYPDSRAGARW